MPYKNKEHKNANQKARTEKRRVGFFNDKKCVECGSVENLELDHIDPKQKTSHRIWSWGTERRLKELKKCQVLCRDCHLKKTSKYRRERMEHGTLGMYKSGRCKCQLCRNANAQYEAKRRA